MPKAKREVAKLVNATDLKSVGIDLSGFKSRLPDGVTFKQLEEMALQAVNAGVGVSWIPYFVYATQRGKPLVF